MLALISLSSIRASTLWDFANGNLINVASTAGEVEDFHFVSTTFTGSSVSVDQKHPLGLDAAQSLEIGRRCLLAETLETLLLWLFAFLLASSFWLGRINA
jgi:hypothetical protein